jgi:nicotinamide mononucleotide transporter
MSNIFIWTPLEIAANLMTVICIVLAGRNSVHTWWTGIIGSILFGILFFQSKLYADSILQVFFIVTSIMGWMAWSANKLISDVDKQSPIINTDSVWLDKAFGLSILFAIGYGTILKYFTDAYAPTIDSTVLAFSILAQLLLMRRAIETWIVWVLVNTLSVPLFWSRELYLTSVLYSFFWVNAIVSYFYWKKLQKEQE